MAWQTIDFHGIIQFDRMIVDTLSRFLEEKESRLAQQILVLIPPANVDAALPKLVPSPSETNFSDVVAEFVKKRSLSSGRVNPELLHLAKDLVKEVNAILWQYVEVLEGCAVELFHRAKVMTIDQWTPINIGVVGEVQELLIIQIISMTAAIKDLETPLKEYCQLHSIGGSKRLHRWISFGEQYLDSNLLNNLEKTELFLKKSYGDFKEQIDLYSKLTTKADESFEELKNYPVFAFLDMEEQNRYFKIFRLLKVLAMNESKKNLIGQEVGKTLKYGVSIDHAMEIFRTYLNEIREIFFKSSLEWKFLHQSGEGFHFSVEEIQKKNQEMVEELRSFMQTMSGYRTFILENDSNPYVRSRWGFSEWVVGPEPAKAKKIADLIYSSSELSEELIRFEEALMADPSEKEGDEVEARNTIEELLHEMGQPLISQSIMKSCCEKLLDSLSQCDEIGSPKLSMIYYVGDVLSKAMRLDWKYHCLQEFYLFHRLYQLHQGFVEHFEDPAHAFRLERFELLMDQIRRWIEKKKVDVHLYEIELDMNDMKAYLQDFLATVQRAVKDKCNNPFYEDTIHRLHQQLVEYRYLFGRFFASIVSKGEEGALLRNQFLFIDQYFESVENLLSD